MYEHRQLLHSDVFSHSLYGADCINFEWLTQVLLYLTTRWMGLQGAYFSKVLLGLSACGICMYFSRKQGIKGPLYFLLMWASFHIMQVRLCARMELVTLNLMGIFMALILAVRKSEKLRSISPWIFAGLTILWVNMHVGFIYGLGLLVSVAIGARWAKSDKTLITAFDRAILYSFIGTLINPYGFNIYRIFIEHLKSFHQYSPSFIQEFTPSTIQAAPYFWLAYVATLIMIIYLFARRNHFFVFFLPALLLFALYGSPYLRATALFTFPFVGFFSETAAMLHSSRLVRWLQGEENSWGWALCVIPLLIDIRFFTMPLPKNIVDETVYPVGACDFVKKNGLQGRMHNPLGYGGYIDWALGPDWKVFVDGRYIFYPILVEEQKILNCPRQSFNESAWKTFFDRYGIDYAIERFDDVPLLSKNDFLRFRSVLSFMFPKKEWALVYWDDASLVFLKRVAAFDLFIKKNEYRYVEPYHPGHTIFLSRQNDEFKNQVLNELRRHNDIGSSFRAGQIRRGIIGGMGWEMGSGTINPEGDGTLLTS
ncbi:MAG: hypothetical protein A2X34_07025 [Elusimicrobia bacterium GWC2_51_8]|nr:MAG: hypothetical protein A2X34_07025 [Elusimicrobia bacterium GWC2_51_8]OGR87895.1 MAG: hypothetical protein A2021_05970 [Elusimicrobia bacterium GWF2_52_66]